MTISFHVLMSTVEEGLLSGHRFLGTLWHFRLIFLSVTGNFCLFCTVNLTELCHLILMPSPWKVTSIQELGKTSKIKSKVMTLEWAGLRTYGPTSDIMTKFKIFFIERNSPTRLPLTVCYMLRLRWSRKRMANFWMCVIFIICFGVHQWRWVDVATVIWPYDGFKNVIFLSFQRGTLFPTVCITI